MFRSILRQEISFFDKKESSPSLLTGRLAHDAEQVQKVGQSGELCYIANWVVLLASEASPLSVHVNRDSWVMRWNIEITEKGLAMNIIKL